MSKQDNGASPLATGLAGADGHPSPDGLGPSGGIPSAERIANELSAIVDMAAQPGRIDSCSISVRYWLRAARDTLLRIREREPSHPTLIPEMKVPHA